MKTLFQTFFSLLIISLFFLQITKAQTAYVPCSTSNYVDVINVATNSVTTTIPVGNAAGCISLSLDGSKAYVSNINDNTVSVINTATSTVIATVPVNNYPRGLSVTPDGSKVYVGNWGINTITIINTATNSVSGTVTVGTSPWGVSVSPDGNKVYVANNSSNTASVINTTTNSVSATIPIGTNPSGACVSPDNSKAYIANRSDNTISVINTSTDAVDAVISVGTNPEGICFSPDGSKAYIANYSSNNVSVINTATNAVISTVPVGTNPIGVSASPVGDKVYVANSNSNSVNVINTATNTVLATIAVGNHPVAFGNFIFGAALLSSFVTINTMTCHNQCDASATAYAQGGSSPYVYQWNTVPVQTTQTAIDLCAGSYSVTVTDANVDSIVKTVTIGEYPVYSVNNTQSICTGGSYIINGHTYTTAGNYNDTLSSVHGCDSIVTTNLTVNPIPITSAGIDTTVYSGTPIELYASGGATYQWTPPDYLNNPNSSNPISTPENDITYIVIITNSNGCSNTDTVYITVLESNLWAPNVFNPNDPDPINQKFYVRGNGIKEIKIAVYDRWGEKVFETTDINEGWNGTYKGVLLNTAVFVYCIKATYYSGENVVKKGDVTLLR